MRPILEALRRLRDPEDNVCRAYGILIISGALGFRIGIVAFPSWQAAVETAQVVAGLVHYPAGNPFYIYHTKLWTILHQIGALFLLGGMSEITLSKLLSGVLGMVSFQALSMCVFALSRNVPMAIGAAFFVLATRSASNGDTYPILLMSTEHTYGSLGLSTFVLAAACLGAGCYAIGGFLLGVMPSVHPSLGLWLWITAAICVAWDVHPFREKLRPALYGFFAGAAVTTLSLIVQLTVTYDVPHLDAAERAKYLYAFVRFWDHHRAAVNLGSPAVALNRGAIAIALIWAIGFRDHLSRATLFLLRMVGVCALLGLAMAYVSQIPPERIPVTLLMLMPTRLLNFNGMIVVPLLIGLLGLYWRRLSANVLLAALLFGLLLSPRSMLWEWSPAQRWASWQRAFDPVMVMEMVAIGLLGVAAASWAAGRVGAGGAGEPGGAGGASEAGRAARVARGGVRLAIVGLFALAAFLPWRLRADTTAYFRDRTNDPFFAAIAAEPSGLVLTAGSYQFVQLYTRRPVLLDGALDTLPYALESGPAMQRILLDVYGADLFNPPEGARNAGALPRLLHRALWEQNSRERWQEIGRAYDVTLVVTPAEWMLDLPVAAENRGFRLYRIPR